MFRNTYQAGFLSILYSIGSKPLQIWDTTSHNGYLKRITDEDIQSSVLEIVGTNVSTSYITCPSTGSLGIKLPYLVMIVKNLNKYFTFEITIIDDKNIRRRFRASNFQSSTRVKPFICTMPMKLDEGWNQIQFNLADFCRRAYGTNYMETVKVQIHANCRLRRVYFCDRLYKEEELPSEFKLFLPSQKSATKNKESLKQKHAVETVAEIEKKLSQMALNNEATDTKEDVGQHDAENEHQQQEEPLQEEKAEEIVAIAMSCSNKKIYIYSNDISNNLLNLSNGRYSNRLSFGVRRNEASLRSGSTSVDVDTDEEYMFIGDSARSSRSNDVRYISVNTKDEANAFKRILVHDECDELNRRGGGKGIMKWFKICFVLLLVFAIGAGTTFLLIFCSRAVSMRVVGFERIFATPSIYRVQMDIFGYNPNIKTVLLYSNQLQVDLSLFARKAERYYAKKPSSDIFIGSVDRIHLKGINDTTIESLRTFTLTFPPRTHYNYSVNLILHNPNVTSISIITGSKEYSLIVKGSIGYGVAFEKYQFHICAEQMIDSNYGQLKQFIRQEDPEYSIPLNETKNGIGMVKYC